VHTIALNRTLSWMGKMAGLQASCDSENEGGVHECSIDVNELNRISGSPDQTQLFDTMASDAITLRDVTTPSDIITRSDVMLYPMLIALRSKVVSVGCSWVVFWCTRSSITGFATATAATHVN
jgi:hypothetical protein